MCSIPTAAHTDRSSPTHSNLAVHLANHNSSRWFEGNSILKNLFYPWEGYRWAADPRHLWEWKWSLLTIQVLPWGGKERGSVLAGAQLAHRQIPLWKRETRAQVGRFSLLEMLTRFCVWFLPLHQSNKKLRHFHVWYWTHTFALGICVL